MYKKCAFFGISYLIHTKDNPSINFCQECGVALRKCPQSKKVSDIVSKKIMIVAENKMIVRREVGVLVLLPLLTSSLPNNVRIGEFTPYTEVNDKH
jgi:hypothetical protein